MLILNGLPCFPDSHFFTYRPYGRGASVVDYVLTSHKLLPFIRHFSISPILLANHALFSFSLFHPSLPSRPTPNYLLFDEGDLDIFSSTLRKMLQSKTQFSLLDYASTKYTCLSSAIWEATLKSFPHSTRSTSISPKVGSCAMNKWYVDECKTLHREL